MKIRLGFVSNSSSSSYVVAFRNLPSSQKELQKMMFGKQQFYHGPYGGKWDTNVVAKTVWELMQNSTPNDLPDLEKGFDAYDLPKSPYELYPNHSEMPSDEWNRIQDEYYTELDRLVKDQLRKFMHKNRKSFVYRFEFSDNDGEYFSALEHGDLFERLPHVKCSHH